jgi:hypothetical protein
MTFEQFKLLPEAVQLAVVICPTALIALFIYLWYKLINAKT